MSDRYYRLVTFVINICPKPLRELFISKAKQDKNTQYTTLKDYLVFRKQDIDTLKSRNKINTDQRDHIFPSDGIVDIQTWDVTLLSALLKGLFMTELDCAEIRCIDEITNIRNDLQHISGTESIEEEQFDLLWENLKRAVLKLSECAGAPNKCSIEEEIKKALIENMPNLGNVLRTWHKVLYIQLSLQNKKLSLQNKKLEEELKKQSSKIRNVGATSAKAKAILLKASRKTQGRSGAAGKALNIWDIRIGNMEDKFKKGYNKPFSGSESYRDYILLITKQLNENHRVVVTGNNDDLNYKCAYAAIKGIYQCIDQCLEINDPSEWKLVTPENAKLVLFNEPFGRLKFDKRKYEAMIVEIDEMLSATQEEDDDRIDVVIVANQRHLEEAKDHTDHEMLCTSTVVEIDSGDIVDKTLVVDDTIHRNLLAMAKTFKESYIPKEVDRQAKEKAKRLFIDQSMVVIDGPTGSGKTSLSFELLSSYDLSNGEDNFVVISDPSELKFVNLSLHPLIIIKSLCGVKFNHAEAHRWYSQLDRLYAAVKENQIAVIITIESKVFQMIQSNMPPHQLLACTVTLTSSSVNERENGGKDTIDCEVQTDDISLDLLSEGNSTQAGATVDENTLRSVKGFREYRISRSKIFSSNRCRIISFSILPSGEILLIEYSGKLIKLNIDFKVISTLQIGNGALRSCVCYTGKDTAVILNQDQLLFVNIKEDMSLIKSRSISHKCYSLASYTDKLYAIDKCSVYVYSTDGDFLKDLYESRHTMLELIDIAVRNDGSMIFIMTDVKKLITIDNFGNTLFMLDIPDIEGVFIGNQIRLCVGFHDNVFIFGEIQKGSNQKKIVQVHPGSRSCRVILQFESDTDYYAMQYDFDKCSVILAGNSNMLTVLELR